MLEPRTLKIWALVVGTFLLLCVPAYAGPAFLEEASAMFALLPVLSIYLFHAIGVPGLLEHQGHCGWGMCNPTAFGLAFVAACWLFAFWLAAWGLAYLSGRR